MNLEAVKYLVSPTTRTKLHLVKPRISNSRVVSGRLVSEDGREMFPIVAGIPFLQPGDTPAEWVHPLNEVLFGPQAFEIVQQASADGLDVFQERISAVIRSMGQDGVRQAFEWYAQLPPTERYRWIGPPPDVQPPSPAPGISRRDFARAVQRIRPSWGKRRLAGLKASPWPGYLMDYVTEIAHNTPNIMLELGCGACWSLQAVVEGYRSFSRLFTVDIDFMCAKVADGLFSVQGERHRVEPVVASFWFLPMRNNSVEVVFTHNGLDESREIDRVVEEVARVLVKRGRFVVVAHSQPTFIPVYAELGFTQEEMQAMAVKARLYGGQEHLCAIASSKGLKPLSVRKVSSSESRERTLFVFEKSTDSGN